MITIHYINASPQKNTSLFIMNILHFPWICQITRWIQRGNYSWLTEILYIVTNTICSRLWLTWSLQFVKNILHVIITIVVSPFAVQLVTSDYWQPLSVHYLGFPPCRFIACGDSDMSWLMIYMYVYMHIHSYKYMYTVTPLVAYNSLSL